MPVTRRWPWQPTVEDAESRMCATHDTPRGHGRCAAGWGDGARRRGRGPRHSRTVQRGDLFRRSQCCRGPRAATSPSSAASASPTRRCGAIQPRWQRVALAAGRAHRRARRAAAARLPRVRLRFFGAIKIGAVPIPTNTLFKPADYEYILNDSRARVVVISEALLPQLQAIPRERLRYLRDSGRRRHAADAGMRHVRIAARRTARPSSTPSQRQQRRRGVLAVLLGQHRLPEGLRAPAPRHGRVHRALRTRRARHRPSATAASAWPSCSSRTDWATRLYFPFASAPRRCCLPGRQRPPTCFKIVDAHHPTLFFSVPTNYATLLAQETRAPISSAASAGASRPARRCRRRFFERFLKRFGVSILDGIGSTEICHIFISNQPGAIRPGSSGKPVPGYEYRLLDDDGQPTPTARSATCWCGATRPARRTGTSTRRPKDTIEGHWIRTGDKYSMTPTASCGTPAAATTCSRSAASGSARSRSKTRWSSTRRCSKPASSAAKTSDRLIKPLAYVVLAPGQSGSDALARELQDFVRGKLAEYKRPRWVEFVAELPKTATGKTQRFKLREESNA